jgi:hypothetical protein
VNIGSRARPDIETMAISAKLSVSFKNVATHHRTLGKCMDDSIVPRCNIFGGFLMSNTMS